MSEQEIKSPSPLPHSTTNNSADWRTEPEINVKRQEYLNKRRAITPDIKRGIYPFKGVKLNRADIVWLLVTHEQGRGPVDWSDASQRDRKGLDIRGANLRGADLHGLPLARIQGGLTEEDWFAATPRQSAMATAHLEGANLSGTHLEGAAFCRAHLTKANLSRAFLGGADLFGANLQEVCLYKTSLEGANLHGANLEGAKISQAELQGAKVDETLTKVVDAERLIVPYRAKELKLPSWSSDWLKLLLVPLVLSVIGIWVTQYLSYTYTTVAQKIQNDQKALAQKIQNDQKAFQVKNDLVSKMSTIVAASLTELHAIQYNEEGTDFTAVFQNFWNKFRDMRTNGAELEGELSAYFGNQACPNLADYQNGGYNWVFWVWHIYYNSMITDLYYLTGYTFMESRREYINDLKQDFFSIYKLDRILQPDYYKVNLDALLQYYSIPRYGNTISLVQMDGTNWGYAEYDIENFRYIMGQCIRNSTINPNALV
jgi:uncharacterized protein YjbI with pentapeptide repeats